MSMNIKNEEAHRLAKELAACTGETVTEAVTVAIRERLHRERRARDTGMVDAIMAIAKDAAPRWKEPWRSIPHGDLLYDADGLPK